MNMGEDITGSVLSMSTRAIEAGAQIAVNTAKMAVDTVKLITKLINDLQEQRKKEDSFK